MFLAPGSACPDFPSRFGADELNIIRAPDRQDKRRHTLELLLVPLCVTFVMLSFGVGGACSEKGEPTEAISGDYPVWDRVGSVTANRSRCLRPETRVFLLFHLSTTTVVRSLQVWFR